MNLLWNLKPKAQSKVVGNQRKSKGVLNLPLTKVATIIIHEKESKLSQIQKQNLEGRDSELQEIYTNLFLFCLYICLIFETLPFLTSSLVRRNLDHLLLVVFGLCILDLRAEFSLLWILLKVWALMVDRHLRDLFLHILCNLDDLVNILKSWFHPLWYRNNNNSTCLTGSL